MAGTPTNNKFSQFRPVIAADAEIILRTFTGRITPGVRVTAAVDPAGFRQNSTIADVLEVVPAKRALHPADDPPMPIVNDSV